MSTKIHAATEALGLPVRLIGSPGQRNDIALAHELVEGIEADALLADKGYDADHLCDRTAEAGTKVVIPPKRNRKVQRAYDADLHKERNIIERSGSLHSTPSGSNKRLCRKRRFTDGGGKGVWVPLDIPELG